MNEVFQDILDYASLDERSQKAIDAANALINPAQFQERVARTTEIETKIFEGT